MSKAIDLVIDTKDFDQLMLKSKKVSNTVTNLAYDKFYKLTPYKTGNAKRNTHLDKNNHIISADYDYAGKLDTGWSKQAPAGMSAPTIDYINKVIDTEIRKL
jgi:hypothetical protein